MSNSLIKSCGIVLIIAALGQIYLGLSSSLESFLLCIEIVVGLVITLHTPSNGKKTNKK